MESKSNPSNNLDTLKDNEKIESAKFIVLGNVDSSKTTSIATLVKNVLDNGNGYARTLITKLKHEIDSGRTSSHSSHYIVKGNEITTLVDLCGHEKYLKTTMFGVMGLFANYGIIVIGAESGVCGMSEEHMKLLIANKLPFIVVIGKIDICPPNILVTVKKDLDRIARRNKKETIYFEDDEKEEDGSYIKNSHRCIIDTLQEKDLEKSTSIMPVILTSNKTGHNINFLRELITSIKSQTYLERTGMIAPVVNQSTINYPMIYYIDSTYSVVGIGIVLSGTVKYGSISLGQKLFIGPINNTFVHITVKSIHNCISEHVEILKENESGCIGIRLDSKGSYTREMFSKGQIVTSDINFAMKHTCYNMECDIAIFNHPTSIRHGYQSTIHIRTARQVAKFIFEPNKILRAGCRERVNIKFMCRPEFVLPGTYLFFRDGRTKGFGKVISILPFREDTFEPMIRPRKRNRGEKFKSSSNHGKKKVV